MRYALHLSVPFVSFLIYTFVLWLFFLPHHVWVWPDLCCEEILFLGWSYFNTRYSMSFLFFFVCHLQIWSPLLAFYSLHFLGIYIFGGTYCTDMLFRFFSSNSPLNISNLFDISKYYYIIHDAQTLRQTFFFI